MALIAPEGPVSISFHRGANLCGWQAKEGDGRICHLHESQVIGLPSDISQGYPRKLLLLSSARLAMRRARINASRAGIQYCLAYGKYNVMAKCARNELQPKSIPSRSVLREKLLFE